MLKQFTLEERSWMLYDWANSAYATIVMAAILPIFYKSLTNSAGIDPNIADSYWAYAIAGATLIIAILAPILGTIGDYRGMKMKLFKVFFVIGVVSTAMLAFFTGWTAILVIYMITTVGFAGANLFYDAFIVDVTTPDRMHKVSSYGYAIGYIGGSTIPFIIAILLITFGGNFGISTLLATQISFLITAVWWAGFTLPFLRHVRQKYCIEPEPNPVRKSFIRLGTTLKNIRQYKIVFMFLLAYFFYIDGVGTIIRLAAVFGDTVGVPAEQMMLALLMTQIVAFPCAIIYGNLAERFTARRMILFGIFMYIIITFLGYRMTSTLEFWLLAFLVATSQGGLQALSRSYYGKIIPPHKANEFYGFYEIFGRFAAIMGPALFGFTTMLTGDSRIGVLSVLLLFIVGGLLFLLLPKTEQV